MRILVAEDDAILADGLTRTLRQSGNAIEVYVHRLRKKLEPGGVRIVTVRGLGYSLEKTPA